MAASAAKYCEKEAVTQSAASAASPDYMRFQAVILVDDGLAALPWILGFLEATLAADLITA